MNKKTIDVFDEATFTYNFKEHARQQEQERWESNHYETHAWLDVDDQHPRLFGDAILLRDDDGMGFALMLDRWRGQHVKITIERVQTKAPQYWFEPKESKA